jgi:hypothetical protein
MRNRTRIFLFVIARSEATKQSDPKGRHERSEVISLLMGIASPIYSGLATASPDCFATLAMTGEKTFYECIKFKDKEVVNYG